MATEVPTVLGHIFEVIEPSRRKCRVCKELLNTPAKDDSNIAAVACVQPNCKYNRLHKSCIADISKKCKSTRVDGDKTKSKDDSKN